MQCVALMADSGRITQPGVGDANPMLQPAEGVTTTPFDSRFLKATATSRGARSPRIEAENLGVIAETIAALPVSGRKPLYVTELGVRGIAPVGEAKPGHVADGTPMGETVINGLQHASFDIAAARLGYLTTVKWDGYFSKYDNGTQAYFMIGSPPSWGLTPVYNVTRMLTHAVRPGWQTVNVDGAAIGRSNCRHRGNGVDVKQVTRFCTTAGRRMYFSNASRPSRSCPRTRGGVERKPVERSAQRASRPSRRPPGSSRSGR